MRYSDRTVRNGACWVVSPASLPPKIPKARMARRDLRGSRLLSCICKIAEMAISKITYWFYEKASISFSLALSFLSFSYHHEKGFKGFNSSSFSFENGKAFNHMFAREKAPLYHSCLYEGYALLCPPPGYQYRIEDSVFFFGC